MNNLSEPYREQLAYILETISKEGLSHPRDLDVAIDAIQELFLMNEVE